VAFRFLAPNYGNQLQFTPDMKKIFVLSILISFAMVSSCQKQSSTAEQQLAQRKAELDAREKALDEREKASDEREKALAEKEKATASARTILPNLQSPGQVRDPAQVKAEGDAETSAKIKKMQQLPAEVQALMPDPAQVQAQRDMRIQQRLSQGQRAREEHRMKRDAAKSGNIRAMSPEQLERIRVETAKKNAMSTAAAPPAAASPEATAPPAAASPEAEVTAPSPSPTPQ